MTFFANRLNIKSMFGFIAKMMMILLCLFWASGALQEDSRKQFAGSLGVFDSMSCFSFFGIIYTMITSSFITSIFTFLALLIFFLMQFCFITFSPFAFTYFALIMTSKFTIVQFCKIFSWLNFFAMTTAFRYDCLRHSFLLNRKLCLEPLIPAIGASGSFYYTQKEKIVNI